jgi:CRP-like cAMP-binding protein
MTDEQRTFLSSLIRAYFPLSYDSMKLVVENCLIKDLEKVDFLSKEGKENSHEYFLLDGVISRSILNDDGEYVTIDFYLAGCVLTPHFARTANGKSIFNLQALTSACVTELPVKVLDSLRYSFEDIRNFGLKVVEKELLKTINHEIAHRTLSARERLLNFRRDYPNLENLIPHSIIASYLGVTPVSFSRLRGELAK